MVETNLTYISVMDDAATAVDSLEKQWEFELERDCLGLEQALCAYVGTRYCMAVGDAHTGMAVALKACGVEQGDGVLCTSFGHFAMADIIRSIGGTPMLVDVNPNTFNIDDYCLEYVLKKCIRTKVPMPKVLIAVDLFGLPCNYDALLEICSRYEIDLIEDISHSLGATYRGEPAGSFGRFAVASFFPNRSIGDGGKGGAVFCQNMQDAKQLEAIAEDQRQKLGSVESKIVLEQLKTWDVQLQQRQEVAARYRQRLTGVVRLQAVGKILQSSHFQFVISAENREARDRIIASLRKNQIPCHSIRMAHGRRSKRSPEWGSIGLVNTKSVVEKAISLPMHPYLSSHVVDFICGCIVDA